MRERVIAFHKPFLGNLFCITSNVCLARRSLAGLALLAWLAAAAPANAACDCLPGDLVGWWKAETSADDSAGANHGTLIGDTTFVTGQVGDAFNLDGDGDYISIPDSAALRPVNLTIEGWFRFSASDGTRLMVSKTLGSGILDSFQLWISGGQLRGVVADNGGFGTAVAVPFAPTPGVWYHIAYTFDDASDTQALYVGGAEAVSGATTKSIGYDTHPVLIGADLESEVPSFFFSGAIDEVSIYSRALAASEILAIALAGSEGKDITPPTLSCPGDAGADCDTWTDTGTTGEATATDNCDPDPIVTFVDTTAGGPCAGTLVVTRTWTATDCAGNTATCEQIITVTGTDGVDPMLICPPDITLTCGSPTDPGATGFATASDNCDPSPSVAFSDAVVGGPCPTPSVITRTWTATDCSGNVATCDQTIALMGSACVCELPGTISWWRAEGDATDSADGNHGVLVNGASFAPGNVGQAFSLDGANDYVSVPDSVSLRPASLTIEGWFNFSASGSIRVLVSKTLGSRFLDSFQLWMDGGELRGAIADGGGFGPFLIHPFVPALNTWYHLAYTFDDATDTQALYVDGAQVAVGAVTKSIGYDTHPVLLGADLEREVPSFFFSGLIDEVALYSQALSATEIQAIHQAGSFGRDSAPPTLVCPPDAAIECGDSIDPSNTGSASASDDCGTPGLSFSDVFIAGCGASGVITRTWTATDACGNSTSCDQIISIEDSTGPMLDCPPDIVIECGDSTLPADTGEATAADACGGVTITSSDAFAPGCGDTGVITRTWTATDDCGNSTSCDQIITIVDTTAPAIACPSSLAVECGESTLPADTGGEATGGDSCGGVLISFSDASAPACGNTVTITRTWTATDDCGNSISCDQIISVVDTTAPSISCPLDVTVDCGESTLPADTGEATGSDSCGGVTVTFVDDADAGCGSIIRTWTVTDDCGNSVSCDQTISITDNNPPTIACPAPATVNCGSSNDPMETGTAMADDGCGVVTLTYSDVLAPDCGDSGVITRTWTATDQCGNAVSCEQLITVVPVDPVLACPPDVIVQCGDPTAPEDTGSPTVMNACGMADMTFSDSFAPDCGSSGVLIRTWTVTDGCGNSDTCEQTITIVDTTAPSLDCPDDITIACGDSTDPMATGEASASDACGAATTSHTDSFSPDCTGAGILLRTWTAVDDCGNSTDCVQTITVTGASGPTIACPGDLTLGCTDSTEPIATGFAVAANSCGPLTTTFSDSFAPGCGSSGVITRTWSATDPCDNTVTCVQVITIEDNAPPTLTCPDNTTAECGASIDPMFTGLASATDDCGPATVTYADTFTAGGCVATITRTWTATDGCGHSVSCQQIILVIDTLPPDITCPPDLTVPADPGLCDATLDPGVVTAADDCDPNPTVAATRSDGEDLSDPFPLGLTMITWVAFDCQGLTATCIQTILVTDEEPPDFVSDDVTLTIIPGDCEATVVYALPGVTENCPGLGPVMCDPPSGSLFAVGTTLVDCEVMDASDNSATLSFEVTITDTEVPSISCPADLTVPAETAAGSMVEYSDPAVADNCPGALDVECVPPSGSMFPISTTTTVTCTVTDASGNAASCSFDVTVNVQTPRGTKLVVRDELVALLDTITDAEDRQRLADAINRLNKTLNANIWIDDSHLVAKKADGMFNEAKKVVEKLQSLRNANDSGIPAAVWQDYIDRLVGADRQLAVIAIEEAQDRGGNAGKISNAINRLNSGDADAAADKPKDAIDDYKRAYKEAISA